MNMRFTNLRNSGPILVGLLALGMRLYELPARMVFTADEEYQATYAATIVQHFHRIWIGVSAGATGFYLGPYWTYFTALWLKLSGGDPLLTGYVAAVLGAVTAGLVVYLGSLVWNRRVGVYAGVLYAALPLLVFFDQRYWNPSAAPLLSVAIAIALVKIKKSPWWLVVLAAALGAIFHVHLALVPLWGVAAYFVWKVRKSINRKVWLTSLLTLAFMFAPLIVFDYYHAGSNILTPYRLLTTRGAGTSFSLGDHAHQFSAALARMWWLRPWRDIQMELRPGCAGSIYTTPSLVGGGIAFVLLLWFLVSRSAWQRRESAVIASMLLVLTLSFIAFPQAVTDYYALGLFPLYLLAVVSRLDTVFLLRKLVPLGAAVLIVASGYTIFSADSTVGLSAKHHLVNMVAEYMHGAPYALVEEGTCHKYGGWRYLFSVYGYKPVASSADASLGWLYPQDMHQGTPHYTVHVGATNEVSPPKSVRFVSGGYTAYLTED